MLALLSPDSHHEVTFPSDSFHLGWVGVVSVFGANPQSHLGAAPAWPAPAVPPAVTAFPPYPCAFRCCVTWTR